MTDRVAIVGGIGYLGNVYIKDIVRAFSAAIVRPRKFEIYNISTGVGAYLVDMAQLIAQIMDKEARLTRGPMTPDKRVKQQASNHARLVPSLLARSRLERIFGESAA